MLRVGFVFAVAFLVCEYLLLFHFPATIKARYALIILDICLFGFFSVALLPTVLDTCVEITFPVDEEISSGLVIMAGNIGSVFYIIGFSLVTQMQIMMLVCACTGGLIYLMLPFFRPRLLRLEFEQRNDD